MEISDKTLGKKLFEIESLKEFNLPKNMRLIDIVERIHTFRRLGKIDYNVIQEEYNLNKENSVNFVNKIISFVGGEEFFNKYSKEIEKNKRELEKNNGYTIN